MNDVMSGLPHDKVRVPYGTKGDSLEQYQQGIVVERTPGVYEEVFMWKWNGRVIHRPASDPLIRRYLEVLLSNSIDMMTLAEHQNASIDAYNKHSALGNNRAQRFKKFLPSEAFIPTVLFDLMEKVSRLTTNCHIIAYDFDYLPPCAEGDLNSPINCINGPIVCRYENGCGTSFSWLVGTCTDAKTYLENKYKCDIFFSTDFTTLSAVVNTLTKKPGHVVVIFFNNP